MLKKEEIKKEISALAEKIKTLAADGADWDALQHSLHALNEKIILLKYFQTLPEENQGLMEKISPDVFPDIKEEVKKETVTDLFGNEISIHEKFSKSKDDKSLADKLQNKRIEDIKSAIGLNERFRFINELFDGSSNEYNVALNQINTFTSPIEAEIYLANLKDVYKWSDENELVIFFRELVSRKFI